MNNELITIQPMQSTISATAIQEMARAARETARSMTKKTARAVTGGGLQNASKMPCKTYNLPTSACRNGAKLALIPGTVCNICYANKGLSKTFAKTVEPARASRLASLENPLWTAAMVRLIDGAKYFRWHSAGDVQSLDHLARIVAVAIALPKTKFWLPTREYQLLQEYQQTVGAFPANIRVRASVAKIDGIAPVAFTGYASGVHSTDKPRDGYFTCRAPKQDNECRNCRACWSDRVAVVSYHAH